MTGRRGNPLVLRKILPNPDLVIASTGADIGFYIVSLVGQVIFNVLCLKYVRKNAAGRLHASLFTHNGFTVINMVFKGQFFIGNYRKPL